MKIRFCRPAACTSSFAACRAQDDPKKGHQHAFHCRFLLKSRFCRPPACSSSFAVCRAPKYHCVPKIASPEARQKYRCVPKIHRRRREKMKKETTFDQNRYVPKIASPEARTNEKRKCISPESLCTENRLAKRSEKINKKMHFAVVFY